MIGFPNGYSTKAVKVCETEDAIANGADEIDMVGYLGSVLVVSMRMSLVINTIGSGIFAVYALIIHSYPTALMNFCLVSINVYNLVKLSRKDQSYDLIDAEAGKRHPYPYIFGKGIRHTYGIPDEDGICQGEWNICQENRDRSVTDSYFAAKSYIF